jgi:hypothetical protein
VPYDSLTNEQKQAVQNWLAVARPLAGELARLLKKTHDAGIAWGAVSTALSSLANGDLIPNATGLDGAAPIDKERLTNLAGYFITLSATADGAEGSYNTAYHRAIYLDAAGLVNTI